MTIKNYRILSELGRGAETLAKTKRADPRDASCTKMLHEEVRSLEQTEFA